MILHGFIQISFLKDYETTVDILEEMFIKKKRTLFLLITYLPLGNNNHVKVLTSSSEDTNPEL